MHVFLYIFAVTCAIYSSESTIHDDKVLAFPYTSHRQQRDEFPVYCKKYSYGKPNNVKYINDHSYLVDGHHATVIPDNTTTFSMTHGERVENSSQVRESFVETYHTSQSVGVYWDKRDVNLHIMYVKDPVRTVSVYEPLHDGTCQQGHGETGSVRQTSGNRQCILAVNAGFFDTKTGECYGNIVSDGRLVQHTGGIENAHFGVTKTGALFFGYLTDIDIVADDFLQLVGGVLWVLKNGEIYIDQSIATECKDTETTGTLERFASVVSARTLVGHDADGRIIIMQVDGKTDRQGVNLFEAAELMKKYGAINAINLDGGGSSTLVINHTLANYPSDICAENLNFHCERNVSTILCIHEPFCDPKDCGGHGSCDLGQCNCHGYWTGSSCDILECPDECSHHGDCTEVGCKCFAGFHGDTCSKPCDNGWYGDQCGQRCSCDNNATCDAVSGDCQCLSGYTGTFCQLRCSFGYYGDNCSDECSCEDVCSCDHVTGSCNYTLADTEVVQASQCLQEKLRKQKTLEGEMSEEYRYTIVTLIVLATTTFLSISLNLIFLWKYCTKWKLKESGYKRARSSKTGRMFVFPQQKYSSFSTSTSDNETMETSFMKTRKSKS